MSSLNNSVHTKTSRYVQGALTEVGPTGLEWWARFTFPTDISDIVYTVNETTVGRLDKIANYFLNDPQLWWLIAQYNNILDPYSEIELGRVLYIPSTDRVQLMMTQKTGGIPTQRGNESILPPVIL